ncbi:hypothetical protein [Candidatus Protochlamydia phocaeensis]|uniref:hypothetical protein n=1 Tax=Candidatus Protochlamydia phocaeensis TaxID=1414722 RepID=UPI0008380D4C|nr:hypothetical protein [Candidatus Protochlamydia phocaeensis]
MGRLLMLTGYIASLAVLIFGFLLFYGDTQEFFSSISAAVLSALLVLISFIALSWLARVFTR